MIYKSLIHTKLSVASSEPPSTPDEINSLHQYSRIQIPDEFINLISQATEIELMSSDCCFRIWGASGCIEMNQAYDIQKYIPDSLAIGDNEAGSILTYAQKNGSSALYLISLSNLDMNDAVLVSKTLNEVIFQGKNIHLFV